MVRAPAQTWASARHAIALSTASTAPFGGRTQRSATAPNPMPSAVSRLAPSQRLRMLARRLAEERGLLLVAARAGAGRAQPTRGVLRPPHETAHEARDALPGVAVSTGRIATRRSRNGLLTAERRRHPRIRIAPTFDAGRDGQHEHGCHGGEPARPCRSRRAFQVRTPRRRGTRRHARKETGSHEGFGSATSFGGPAPATEKGSAKSIRKPHRERPSARDGALGRVHRPTDYSRFSANPRPSGHCCLLCGGGSSCA